MFEHFEAVFQRIEHNELTKITGKISKVVGLLLESIGPACSIGEICFIKNKYGDKIACKAEVVGFRDDFVLLMAIGSIDGIGIGSEVIATGRKHHVIVSDHLLGRVVNGFGEPIDEKGYIQDGHQFDVYRKAPNPLTRAPIVNPLSTGIKAIDGLLTIGQGQRIGIFAGSGVGKSTVLGMIAKQSSANINVIALIGERGREVNEFILRDLGEEALARSVVVVATSDQDALVRVKCAFVATSIAEYFRDQGNHVLLMMDSITRMSMAQREIGLTVGEPPTTKGYPPSVFALMPKLMERAGNNDKGSITAIYTVLVEGDDMNEPIADTARGILDGHIVLSRKLAAEGHYPAIDVLESISRLMSEVVNEEHQKSAKKLLSMLALYKESEDLISIGAYKQGANPALDEAIQKYQQIIHFLRQDVKDYLEPKDTLKKLLAV
jgi:flagellum-specific ATP synthase